MTPARHQEFLARVLKCKGFVAVSGYSNDLYEDNPWDNRIEWEAFVSIQSVGKMEGNSKEHHDEQRGH